MVRLSRIVFLILFSTTAFAQVIKPAKWKFSVKPENSKVGETAELIFDVKLDEGWYIYSNDFDPELGPIPTTADFKKNDSYQLVGKLKAIHPKKKFDEIWGGDITYFTKSGQFVQKIIVLKEKVSVAGTLDFQTCTEKDGQCVPGNEKFTFSIDAQATEPVAATKPEADGLATEPVPAVTDVTTTADTVNAVNPTTSIEGGTTVSESSATEPISTEKPKETRSMWEFLLLAFGAGLASIFMPCIYPIMPMTVSFFTKQKNGKSKVLFYGASIMFIFAVIGLITMAFGAPFLNFISTHWLPNTIFFIIFILFGVSLLGAFEIVLPNSTVNKIDQMSDKGGLVGIFFMALTLVVVSFSCTVPFVGSLLIMAAGGEVLRPLYGMLAFGLPFALVFTLLAMFPQYLKNLPKSGGWLNELKVVFGFLEFALALKFLSNIDLTYHFNLLHRNIFLVIWIVIFFIIGLYILGFIRMSKDSPVAKIAPSRWFFAAIFFAFAFYMIPGVTGKSLSILSGILPPDTVVENSEIPLAHPKMKRLKHDIQAFHDFDDALAYAKEVKKPILIDFTGHACANCRKMEDNVWPNEGVLKRLKENFVIASLYVDDKEELPKEKHYTSTYDDELKTTVGDKNMDLEITKFNNNAQPYYVIVDANGEKLIEPLGYSSAEKFIEFLDKGKAKF